jgi:hypothetical protein
MKTVPVISNPLKVSRSHTLAAAVAEFSLSRWTNSLISSPFVASSASPLVAIDDGGPRHRQILANHYAIPYRSYDPSSQGVNF